MSGGLDGQLQLNVTKICETGRCTCSLKPGDIQVTRQDQVTEAKDFISCTHKRRGNEPFLLQQVLGDGDNRLKQNLDVTSVTVYYWKRALTNPLFLKVKRSDRGDEEYYYKYAEDEPEARKYGGDAKTWTLNPEPGLQLQQRLDDRNCGVNRAIVYDLTNNYTDSTGGSESSTKSTCKNEKRKITSVQQSSITLPESSNYTVKEYNVTGKDNDTRISRVIYGGAKTDGIIPPLTPTSKIRVYYWKYGKTEKTIPLLIEFKPHGTGIQSTWFANTSQASINWTDVKGDTNFYDTGGTTPQNPLTTKLDYVNCTVNNVTTIDIGKRPDSSYCHEKDSTVGEQEHTSLIQVTNASKESTYNNKIGRFVVYSHTVNPEVSKQKSHLNKKFHISGFKNGGTDIKLNELPQPPLLNVTKFLVFWCSSGPKAEPLLFYIEYTDSNTGGSQQKEWFKKPKNDNESWIKLDDNTGKPPNAEDTNAIWDILNSYETECKFKWWHIITGTAGGGATGGVGYWAYKGFEWFFMAPWPRLM